MSKLSQVLKQAIRESGLTLEQVSDITNIPVDELRDYTKTYVHPSCFLFVLASIGFDFHITNKKSKLVVLNNAMLKAVTEEVIVNHG